MAYDATKNEKEWYFSHNVPCNGDSDYTVGQNWMYNLFTSLSGGNGNSDAAWEIVSSSNGTTVAAGGANISSSTDFVSTATGGSALGWFMAKKTGSAGQDSGILPRNATEELTEFMQFTMAYDQGDAYTDATFYFDREAPMMAGSTTAAPTMNGTGFSTSTQFIFGHSAVETYFNCMIDTTGSFYSFSSKTDSNNNPTQFTCCVARLETPRSSSVDPYPVFLKCGYLAGKADTTEYSFGNWAGEFTSKYASTSWNLPSKGAQAMWQMDGGATTSDDPVLIFPGGYFYQYSSLGAPWFGLPATGAPIDGTYPLLPTYVWFTETNTGGQAVRGRLPDVHIMASSAHTVQEGTSIVPPGNVTPYKSCTGNFLFPASASFLPGFP